MNARLVEGMDKFLAKYKDEDKKKAPKKLKEDFEKDEELSVEDYLPAGKDIMKFFVAGTMREKIKATKEVLTAMRDEVMDIGAPDEPDFYKKDENIKEFIFDMQDNTGKFGHLLGDDEDDEEEEIDSIYHDASEEELRKMGVFDNLDNEEELDEGCKKPLNEDSILDKINKYLDSIGEAPITESKEEDEEKVADKEKETITESKKSVKVSESLNRRSAHPGNLFESLNRGFEKLYGKVEDPILENKYSSSKSKRK